MLEAGAHLGAYTIVRPLGAGGMGVVYLARHRHIGRDAAIKVLLPELTQNEDIVARFLTEARATAAIRHPGIVEILDCDIDATGRAYIVMEYLRGESLANCLARARRSLSALPSVVSVGSQVASGLAAAHERGIVHRDLKPDNLFLSTDGGPRTPVVVKILDFGIAKLVSGNTDGNINKTRTGSMLGTPAYMSPEQARDASAIDGRADVYALGCILFEMVAGRPPFVRPGAGEVMIAHVIEAPPRLSSLVPEVDPTLEALVSQMLEKDAAARPQTMTEVQSRLDKLIPGRPAPLMTAIMPAVDSGQPHQAASSTPAPGDGTTARGPGVPLDLSRDTSSPSGRMAPGSTLLLPSTATTTHSTTMSDSAAEVSTGSTKTLSSRRNPLLLGGAIAAVGLIVVIVAFAVSSGSSPKSSPAGAPVAARPTAPTVRAVPAVRPPPSPAPAPTPAEDPVETAAVKQDETAPAASPEERPTQLLIEVDSSPSDAEVWLPGEREARGRTPFRVALDRKGSPTRVVLKVPGYADRTVKLDPARPDPVKVTLEKMTREKAVGTASSSTASSKKKGSDTTGAKPSNPSGYKMMGD
jgi:serine/threonine-protein kinase